MFCPRCGTENPNNNPYCGECGLNLAPPIAPYAQPVYVLPPQRSSTSSPVVKAIIAFVIAVPLISIMSAIAIPALLNARRNSNQKAALATVQEFYVYAHDQAMQNDPPTYWGNEEYEFGDFAHVYEKSGYCFYYDSNSIEDNATKFIYFAIPYSWSTGRIVFLVDERGDVYEKRFANISQFQAFDVISSGTDWSDEFDGESYLRLYSAEGWVRK